ncbi:flagellin N-terminal helical domain-containing protein [Vibrio alfacsensis]|uniref:flagellin N-terminal helical domain-containing protein n=1 Tax=Vibrio alfacsensis TaxID=1074311 RepID=UPI0040694272
MALSMHTNYTQLVTQNQLNKTNSLMSTAMERLSTGFRINSAADDAAGLQIANRLEAQTRGMSVAMRNAQDGISMMQTAEGAMDEMTNIAYRMKDLATQSANGTNTDADRAAMNAEFKELNSELTNIFENTNFGGRSLFDGADSQSLSKQAVQFQIGSTANETLSLDVTAQAQKIGQTLEKSQWADAALTQMNANLAADAAAEAATPGDGELQGTYTDYADLQAKAEAGDTVAKADLLTANAWDETASANGAAMAADAYADSNYGATKPAAGETLASVIAANTSDITTAANATDQINSIDSFIGDLGAARSQFGANINRLEHTMVNLGNMSENLTASKGRIMDADFAIESSNMTKNQMLMQAGTSMLAQTKQMSGMAMSLLG